jgi:uncharacterized membrane protein YfcA
MRQPTPSRPVFSPVFRIVTVLLIAVLLMPASGWAADDEKADEPPPAPIQRHWYDPLVHQSDVGVDLILVRPLAGLTLIAGGLLFVPAALITAPNGTDSIRDAYERFVREPGEYFYSRPLGEF